MVRHNQPIPNVHLRKDWQRYIKTHFDQPFRKRRRARLRRLKSATKAPRPLHKLRPIVACPTQRYNTRVRAGRGFSTLEIKKAGLKSPQYARTLGVSVEARRRNKSLEGLARNVKRIKQYMERLVLFPLKPKGKDLRNKEKMIQYFTSFEKAKQRIRLYKRFARNPIPIREKRSPIESVVDVQDVPDFQARATQKSEWLVGKHHFRWRRRNKRLARRRKVQKEKAEAKAAKAK